MFTSAELKHVHTRGGSCRGARPYACRGALLHLRPCRWGRGGGVLPPAQQGQLQCLGWLPWKGPVNAVCGAICWRRERGDGRREVSPCMVPSAPLLCRTPVLVCGAFLPNKKDALSRPGRKGIGKPGGRVGLPQQNARAPAAEGARLAPIRGSPSQGGGGAGGAAVGAAGLHCVATPQSKSNFGATCLFPPTTAVLGGFDVGFGLAWCWERFGWGVATLNPKL
jgi:hypothetical protein